MAIRNIIEIDEDKCNGCGKCVSACAEGAIQMVNGKAKLVSDVYCDGLGACIGDCPTGALKVIQREAADFDEERVKVHLKNMELPEAPTGGGCPGSMARSLPQAGGCPGSAARSLAPEAADAPSAPAVSQLGNWPVQLHLAPPQAPYFQDADLLLVADCVPFACPDFHTRILKRKPVVVGCPKLDATTPYVDKLAQIIAQSNLKSLTIVHMEVPCCTGLLHVATKARELSTVPVPLTSIVVGIDGTIQEERPIN